MFKEKKVFLEPELRIIRIRISDMEKNSFEHNMVFTKSWKTNFLHIDLKFFTTQTQEKLKNFVLRANRQSLYDYCKTIVLISYSILNSFLTGRAGAIFRKFDFCKATSDKKRVFVFGSPQVYKSRMQQLQRKFNFIIWIRL